MQTILFFPFLKKNKQMSSNYYDILGVSKGATTEEIKKAYRQKALHFHPDRPTGDTEIFQKIQEAYETLVDENKRTAYDTGGESAIPETNMPNPFSSAAGVKISDIFQELFRHKYKPEEKQDREPTHKVQRPQDIHFNFTLSSRDLYFGCDKRVRKLRFVYNFKNAKSISRYKLIVAVAANNALHNFKNVKNVTVSVS